MSVLTMKICPHLRRFCCLFVVATLLMAGPVGAADFTSEHEKKQVILFLVDHSESITGFPIPPTIQASLMHVLHLAELSPEPPIIGVIFFGGSGVTVIGDDHDRPTAAIGTLRKELLANWPALEGATPMDSAFEEATGIVNQLPDEMEVTVVLIGDGFPDSGFLRPDDFPEIEEIIRKRKEQIANQNADFPAAIVQELLSRYEQELRDPSTKTFQELYLKQLKLEYAATLRQAEALRAQQVRLITLAFADIPELVEIHESAGGVHSDFVKTLPHDVISQLHELHLIDLPRVVQLPTIDVEADPNLFEQEIRVPVETIGEAAVVALEFHPAIPELSEQATLEAIVEGTRLEFTLDGRHPEAVLATDAQGNVATATLQLEQIPQGGEVRLAWHSTDGSLPVPACSVHTFLRLREDLQLRFRPTFADDETVAPLTISPNHETTWSVAVRTGDDPQPYPLEGVEAVLRHRRTQDEQRLPLQADARAPRTFLSSPLSLTAGEYDVELHLQLESGASFRMTLSDHIHSVLANERVSLETRQPGKGVQLPSFDRRWVSFGTVGDSVRNRTVEILLRSVDVDYSLPVVLESQIADPEGNVPDQRWITFNRQRLTLQPGRAETVRVTLQVPENVEKTIQDGLFVGQLVVLREETREPLRIERFQELSGIDNQEPVEQVTFELKRPQFQLQMPYALKNWLRETMDGRLEGTVRVSIDCYFRRTVTVVVAHDSTEPRMVTVLPSGLITDRQGKQVPTIRLTPMEDDSTKEIAVGATEQWQFLFEMEGDDPVETAQAGFEISASGVTPASIDLAIERADPLLAEVVRTGGWVLVGCLGLLVLRSWLRYWRAAPLMTGRQHEVSLDHPLPYLLRFEEEPRGVTPVVTQDCRVTPPGKRNARLLVSEQRLNVAGASEEALLRVQPGDDDDEPIFHVRPTILSSETEPELVVDVEVGGKFDRIAGRAKRTLVLSLLLGGGLSYVILNLSQPDVLETVQWTYDLFVPLS